MTADSTSSDSPQLTETSPRQPSAARVYDYVLGGKDNFQVDRDAAEAVRAVEPEAFESAIENRQFLIRVVRELASRGIDQFLDIGSGLPTQQNVHQVAPKARVVYVDNDESVRDQARALLSGNDDRTAFIYGDLRDVETILNHPDMSLIDFSRPVAILLVAVVHFVSDADRPRDLIETLAARTSPGSYLALSHVLDEAAPELKQQIRAQYSNAPAPIYMRSHEEIRELFGRRELEDPGLVDITDWRPDERRQRLNLRLLSGLARLG